MRAIRIGTGVFVASLTLLCAPMARAEDVHARVSSILADLVGRLAPEERSRTTGVYVAFDDSRTDVVAQAACDDDGDYVVLVSEAALDLVERVSVASSLDEITGSHVLAEYDSRLSSQQLAEAPLLPLPAGAYDAFADPALLAQAHDRAWTSALRYLLGAELSHETSGRLVCPRPTATRERGDDAWTAAEREAASRAAEALYSTETLERADQRSLEQLFDAGAREDGGVALLSAMSALESRGLTTYARYHPHAVARKARLSAWATDWRARGIRGATRAI